MTMMNLESLQLQTDEAEHNALELLVRGTAVGVAILGANAAIHAQTAEAVAVDSYPGHTITVPGDEANQAMIPDTTNLSATILMEYVATKDEAAVPSVETAMKIGNQQQIDRFAAFVTGISGDGERSAAYNAAAQTAPTGSNIIQLTPKINPLATTQNMQNIFGSMQSVPSTTEATTPTSTLTPAPQASIAGAESSKLWTPTPPTPSTTSTLIVPKIETPPTTLLIPAPPQIETPELKTVLIPTNNNIAAVQSIDGKSADEIQAELKYNETKWGILPGWDGWLEGDYFGESGDRTTAVGDNGTAFGLFQARGDRAVGMPSDWYGQDDFAMADLKRYNQLWETVHTVPNPTEAQVQYVFQQWERYKVAGSRYVIGKLITQQMQSPIQVQERVIVTHNLDGSEHFEKAA